MGTAHRQRPGLGPRRSRLALGVRLQSSLAAASVVAVAFAVAAGVFVWQYRLALVANVDEAAKARASDVANEVTTTAGQLAGERLAQPAGELSVSQVVDASGTVVAASPGLRRRSTPISGLRPGPGRFAREDRELEPDQGPFRIVATGVSTSTGRYTILVAQSLRPVDASVETALALIAIGFPILLLVVGGATFVFVGRSLRPVEAIRQRVATITGHDLHARVPVPASGDEVARLAETMNRMLDRLEVAATAQRRFVADASHELRSPLATLRAGLELLAARPAPAPVVATLVEEADRLDRLIAGLLILARADDQGLVRRVSDVDLDDVVDDERVRLAHAAPNLSVETRAAPVRVHGNAHELAQAVRNLVDNAARYARSTVMLRVWQDEHHAFVDVADDGPGIPVGDRERIFERFVRLDESRSRDAGAGSGLGLAIVREIARAHGGDVDVVDSPTGTVMRLTLPRPDDLKGPFSHEVAG